MKYVYYADCVIGEVVHCEILPDSWDEKRIEDELRKFNARDKTTKAYVGEAEDGSLTAYLLGEVIGRRYYQRDEIDVALDALDDARSAIESLLVARMKRDDGE